MTKTCVVCAKPFSTIYSRQKYCSETCYKQAKRTATRKVLEQRTCLTCGYVFYATATSDKKFCCATCRNNYNPAGEKKKTIDDWVREARICKMTYGKYRAAIEYFGKTFEELQKEREFKNES